VLKEAIKRRKPDFSESYYGFRAFGNLLEEAQNRGLLEFGRDEKSNAYVYRSSGTPPRSETVTEQPETPAVVMESATTEESPDNTKTRSKSRRGRKPADKAAETALATIVEEAPTAAEPAPQATPEEKPAKPARKSPTRRRLRNTPADNS
jgi:hypothetical protein